MNRNESRGQAPQRLVALLLGLGLAACATQSKGTAAVKTEPAPSPVAAAVDVVAPAAPEIPTAQSALQWTAQPGWVVETTTSAMRKAQFRLPRADGDTDDTSLIVYYFGGAGGSREANLERWAGQFEQPDGGDSMQEMQQSTRSVAGMDVTDTDLSGTYIAETSPGSGERFHEENWRMLATIVEHSSGPYYVKLVGPQASVAKWQSSFTAFIDSMRPMP